jgi:hypothetical protein
MAPLDNLMAVMRNGSCRPAALIGASSKIHTFSATRDREWCAKPVSPLLIISPQYGTSFSKPNNEESFL